MAIKRKNEKESMDNRTRNRNGDKYKEKHIKRKNRIGKTIKISNRIKN